MQFTDMEYLTIGASIIGVVFFLISLYLCFKIIKLFPPESQIKKYWYLLTVLVALFLGGYFMGIYAVISSDISLQELLVPVVYFFGAVFVIVMVFISHKTYKMILTD